ncbi:MAG: hypothetical protein GY935_24105 [Gammaproteobacteria bacterium]|nr:hypothetical protein [Gammaproteobacteria bacterium]
MRQRSRLSRSKSPSAKPGSSPVADGLAQIPTLDGVGYTVDNGVYSAYAILDGRAYDVDFNVLSPSNSPQASDD